MQVLKFGNERSRLRASDDFGKMVCKNPKMVQKNCHSEVETIFQRESFQIHLSQVLIQGLCL